ncbi:Bifunctional inhibitor/plant lipid transfer protein/seed storage helical domain-containing protein [Cynara cardunculus var. scolymus]|uniref:Non-specific lipid-transfer protein n=2 Tax=Cynara cardunculus var. scolymus TaxID=59895 RepID=A0A103XL12_CYNCS|nr:Bifunctional inhibitor/plant lipid transfer protein/seed storage helical domain-containing protein [Cynara cardunculus var. scolymus]
MNGVAIAALVVLTMTQFMVQPSAAITCVDVNVMLEPCLVYLQTGGDPPINCCNGLRRLQVETPTRLDRQTACSCAKTAAIRLQIKQDFASDLPRRCGVVINVPINPNVDCST